MYLTGSQLKNGSNVSGPLSGLYLAIGFCMSVTLTIVVPYWFVYNIGYALSGLPVHPLGWKENMVAGGTSLLAFSRLV